MPDIDPRDQLADASSAYTGLVDLMYDASRINGGGSFEASTPSGILALMLLIREKLEPASEKLLDYQPRK